MQHNDHSPTHRLHSICAGGVNEWPPLEQVEDPGCRGLGLAVITGRIRQGSSQEYACYSYDYINSGEEKDTHMPSNHRRKENEKYGDYNIDSCDCRPENLTVIVAFFNH